VNHEITDPDVAFLATLAGVLHADYVGEKEIAMWRGSPFYWIKGRPSRQIGSIGEALVAGWAAAKGFEVQRPLSSEHDRRIDGLRVEIKFSTLWTDNEIFKFQQLRDQDYEYAFLLGVSPFDAQAWFVPKAELIHDRPPTLVPQHGGSAGRDTKWLSFPASTPPDWLAPFGGRLSGVKNLIESAASKAC
jgi:hypothetical protein